MTLALVVDRGVVVAAPLRAKLRREVARMVRAAALHDRMRDYEVSLRLVGDAVDPRAQPRLSRQGQGRPTCSRSRSAKAPGAPRELLGDIVISVDTAKRQAKRGLYAELLRCSRRTASATCSATITPTTPRSA